MEHFRYEVSFENITTQVAFQHTYALLEAVWAVLSGGRVHSDNLDRAEWTNSDTNSGEVSNGPTKPILISFNTISY